ncbi:nuclear transport factor 2 family protein [Lutibacter flavus]|uniref:SnoaL-like domain-containing protein n=1 Tax=Lutibacter flavus TaxID=691689 RepID=A0A238YS71_9FLAO|nr:nuclear transport factor 2 family protein [Lutibacter flavus]SNR73453.1 SnoaL-like domain-containing protein [Lutibacter flavus]
MKKIAVFLIAIITVSCCKNEQKITENVNIDLEKEAIKMELDTWHKNAAEANFEAYFSAMTSNGIFIGTDASENWKTPEFKDFSKPYFDKGKAWDFTPVDRNIYIDTNGKIAWFDELLDTWMGVCRGSGVLKKIDDSWKIEHYVLSLTTPNDNVQDIIKINKKHDSIFLKRYKK